MQQRINGFLFLLLLAFTALFVVAVPTKALAVGRTVGITTDDVYLKGSLVNEPWALIAENVPGGVTNPKVTSTRIGFLLPGSDPLSATLYIKDGLPNASWTLVAENVRDYSISGNRIGIVTADRRAYIKEGDIRSGFQQIADSAESINLSPHRIGVVLRNSPNDNCSPFGGWCAPATFFVKEYTNTAPWKKVSEGYLRSCFTHCFDSEITVGLTDERIATSNAGQLKIKEGSVEAPWVENFWSGEDYAALYMSGDRVCLDYTSRYCKEGPLTGPFIKITDTYGQITNLSHDRIIFRSFVTDHYEHYIYEGRVGNPISAVKISSGFEEVVLEK